MNWTDNLPESVRRDIREAGRGHLLGDYRSPLDVADEARKRAKEEPQNMNTDKREAEERAAGTFDQAAADAANTGVTSGVHGAKGEDGRRLSDAIAGEGPDFVEDAGDDGEANAEDNNGEDFEDLTGGI